MAKRLDKNQTLVLKGLTHLENMTWMSGSPFTYGTDHRTDNILNSLVVRGLVERQKEKHKGFGVYTLTAKGVEAAQERVS